VYHFMLSCKLHVFCQVSDVPASILCFHLHSNLVLMSLSDGIPSAHFCGDFLILIQLQRSTTLRCYGDAYHLHLGITNSNSYLDHNEKDIECCGCGITHPHAHRELILQLVFYCTCTSSREDLLSSIVHQTLCLTL